MLHYGIISKVLLRLLIVLNDCVCFVFGVRRSSWRDVSVTTLAKDLHVLPVIFRILHNILLTVFK